MLLHKILKILALSLVIIFAGLGLFWMSYTMGYHLGFKGAMHETSIRGCAHCAPQEKNLNARMPSKKKWFKQCTVKGEIISINQPFRLMILDRNQKERPVTMLSNAHYNGVKAFEDIRSNDRVFIVGRSLKDGNFEGEYLRIKNPQ